MPAKPRPGLKGLYVELPVELDAAFRAWCADQGCGVADEIRLAIRRHMAYPPKREPDPLPDGVPPPPPKPKRGGSAK